jgi:hypothetical protein
MTQKYASSFQVFEVYLIRQIAGQNTVLAAVCLAKPSSKACLSKG